MTIPETDSNTPSFVDSSEQLLNTLTQMSVTAIAQEIAASLTAKFIELPYKQSLTRNNKHVIVQREIILENADYTILLNAIITNEIQRIFNLFYVNNRIFCEQLLTHIYAEVYDREQSDVSGEVSNLLKTLESTYTMKSPP